MNILFISEVLPINTSASEVVFYRHLIKLCEEGHSIHILTDQNSYCRRKKNIPSEFKVHIVSNRKWYYPPYKPFGILQKIRFMDYYNNQVKKIIDDFKIAHLIGFVHGDFLAPFSAYVQRKSKLPLISFLHDDPIELNHNGSLELIKINTKKILKASRKILIASEAFYENWPEFSEKFHLLYPIPEKHSHEGSSIRRKNKNLTFGYSGTIYNEMIMPLETVALSLNQLNVHFKIIGDNPKVNCLMGNDPLLEHIPLFKTAEAANIYLIANCDACIIPYPEKVEAMPWIKTCFPSKFIQYCQLNLPTIVIAPKESALGKWCIKNKWLLYSESCDFQRIKLLIEHVLFTSEVKEQVQKVKENEFDPINIHREFNNLLNN